MFLKATLKQRLLKEFLRIIFSRRFLLFTSFFFKEKQKVIMSPFPTGIFWFVFNDWHHSWHNNGLRRLTGLWRKKSQRDLAEGMLGMLVQCIRIPLWYLQSRLCASCHAYRIIMSFRKFIPPFTLTGQNIGKNRNFTPWTIPTENNNNQ